MIKRAFVLAFVAVLFLAALPQAVRSDTQWYDGPWAFSPMRNCVTGIALQGAGVRISFEADPKDPPRVGRTFYGRVIFGMISGCVDPQHADLNIRLPKGVSFAVDAAHPIKCVYSDDNAAHFTAFSDCPQSVGHGTYGASIDPTSGQPWTMPRGRILEVYFPLKSSRPMKGLADVVCPKTLGELATLPQGDCAIAALHVADGYRDPWLLPSQHLVVVK